MFVRPLLDNASQVWSSITITAIAKLEYVQQNYFTHSDSRGICTKKLLHAFRLEVLSYNDRLAMLNLDSLKLRRLRTDLLFCYIIFNNLVGIEPPIAFQYRHTTCITSLNTRSSQTPKTLAKSFCHSTLLEQHLYARFIDIYNSLSSNVTNSITLEKFKKQLSLYDRKPFLKYFA